MALFGLKIVIVVKNLNSCINSRNNDVYSVLVEILRVFGGQQFFLEKVPITISEWFFPCKKKTCLMDIV